MNHMFLDKSWIWWKDPHDLGECKYALFAIERLDCSATTYRAIWGTKQPKGAKQTSYILQDYITPFDKEKVLLYPLNLYYLGPCIYDFFVARQRRRGSWRISHSEQVSSIVYKQETKTRYWEQSKKLIDLSIKRWPLSRTSFSLYKQIEEAPVVLGLYIYTHITNIFKSTRFYLRNHEISFSINILYASTLFFIKSWKSPGRIAVQQFCWSTVVLPSAHVHRETNLVVVTITLQPLHQVLAHNLNVLALDSSCADYCKCSWGPCQFTIHFTNLINTIQMIFCGK